MARPTSLTPELRALVERELATGASQAVVCQRTGVASRTLKRWIAEGRVVRSSEPPQPQPEPDVPLAARLAQAEPGLVGAVIAAAQRGQWQAAAWLLERSFPDRWGKREGRMPAVADPFAEIDELAAKRRARA